MKYKTREAIKALTDNPKLRFRCLRLSGSSCLIIDDATGELRWDGCFDNKVFGMAHLPEKQQGNLLDEWELVQEPVPFLEVVQAYIEGEEIYCMFNGEEFSRYKPLIPNSGHKNFNMLSTKEILEGLWYIEE